MTKEFLAGVNWFFNGHANKVSAKYSYFHYSLESNQLKDGSRVRF